MKETKRRKLIEILVRLKDSPDQSIKLFSEKFIELLKSI